MRTSFRLKEDNAQGLHGCRLFNDIRRDVEKEVINMREDSRYFVLFMIMHAFRF